MSRSKVKKDDVVVVISGANRGKTGKVLSVDREKGRVVVEGVNRRKRATRRSTANPQGGIIEKECPLHISNVMRQDRHEQRQAKRGGKAQQGEDKK